MALLETAKEMGRSEVLVHEEAVRFPEQQFILATITVSFNTKRFMLSA